MAWANVQHTANGSFSNDPVTLAYGSSVTVGNLLTFLYCAPFGTGSVTFTKSAGTATLGTITTVLTTLDAGNGELLSMGWCLVTGGGSCTIQGDASAGSAGSFAQLHIQEWSGNDGSTTTDGSAGIAATGANPNTGNWTTATSGDLILGGAVDSSGSGTLTKGSTFTLLDAPFGANAILSQWKVQSSAGSINADFNNSSSGDKTTMVGAAFTPASGGGGGGTSAKPLSALGVG